MYIMLQIHVHDMHVFMCLTFRNVQVLDLVEVALCKLDL